MRQMSIMLQLVLELRQALDNPLTLLAFCWVGALAYTSGDIVNCARL
jgi:hypothetical protein